MAGKSKAFINGKIIFPDQIVTGMDLLLDGSKIQAITGRGNYNPSDYEIVDLNGRFVSPGFIDLHVHGCLHHTFNETSAEAYDVILRKTLSYGVTTLVPTLVAAPIPELVKTLEFIGSRRNNQNIGRTKIMGAYLESPYISPAASGAIPASAIRSIEDGTIDELLNLHEAISVFMIAPELPGAVEAVRKMKSAGLIISMGHSTATESDILPVIDAGASHVTHLWSAMSSVIRQGPWRKPGLLEVALTRPELTAEIIADNKHLPPTLMKLAVQSKGESLCAVSDALNGAGLEEGAHFFVGDNEYEVVDGVGMVADRSVFAGSTTLLGQELPILVDVVGLSLSHAIRMISTIPANILGIENRTGKIQPGLDADLVLLNDDLSISEVFQQGNRVI